MNANERFEYMAEQFYKKTGMLAPGKDDAIPRSDNYKQEVHCEWAIFAEEFYSNLFQTHTEMYVMLEKVAQAQKDAHNEIDHSDLLYNLYGDIELLLAKARGES